MCTLFIILSVLLTRGIHMVYHGDPIHISYLYDQMWLVGYTEQSEVYMFIHVLFCIEENSKILNCFFAIIIRIVLVSIV